MNDWQHRMTKIDPSRFKITNAEDITGARIEIQKLAALIGFDATACEEIRLVVSELATNILRHAGGGTIIVSYLNIPEQSGMQIEACDYGPGIADVKQAMTDGVSTSNSLGYGLGTVNRLMDEVEIVSSTTGQTGTLVVCKIWQRRRHLTSESCPLDFGIATRPHPQMNDNGDDFFIKTWNNSAVVAVIDGLGHGKQAHLASRAARHYLQRHFDQPLKNILTGIDCCCKATRGIVMALVRFDWPDTRFSFVSIGNIETRLFGVSPVDLRICRGIIGKNMPIPQVTTHPWSSNAIMILHSDGLKATWSWNSFCHLASQPATVLAGRLLRDLAQHHDDATVLVIKNQATNDCHEK